jgi:putative two-component system response regulator
MGARVPLSNMGQERNELHIDANAVFELAKASVDLNAGDDLPELLPELETKLQPFLTTNRREDWAFLQEVGDFLVALVYDDCAVQRIRMLDGIAYAHIPFGKAGDGIKYARSALELARRVNERMLERKLLNQLASLYNDIGASSKGAEYAIAGAQLAEKLNYSVGYAACLGTLTSSLKAMGLYKETMVLAMRVVELCTDEVLKSVRAQAYTNLALSAFSMKAYDLGAQTADKSLLNFGAPSSPGEVHNILVALNASLRNWAAKQSVRQAREKLGTMQELYRRLPLPRFKINVEVSEATCDIAEGKHMLAATQLLGLLPQARLAPGLYVDVLQSLIAVYRAEDDKEKMAKYASELAEFMVLSQSKALSSQLAAIGVNVETLQPGKQDTILFVEAASTQSGEKTTEPGSKGRIRRQAQDDKTVQETLERLAVCAELGEDVSGRHAYRVGRLSRLLAERLQFGPHFCNDIEAAARLHDIGKLNIRDGVINKPGPLDPTEFSLIKKHTIYGDKLLSVFYESNHVAREIALHHHERWDGKGYPDGLLAEKIPTSARIAALADVYDALTHVRVYKKAWSAEKAIEHIAAGAGTHFDPYFTQVFLELMSELLQEHQDDMDHFLVPSVPSAFVKSHDDIKKILAGLPAPWEKTVTH